MFVQNRWMKAAWFTIFAAIGSLAFVAVAQDAADEPAAPAVAAAPQSKPATHQAATAPAEAKVAHFRLAGTVSDSPEQFSLFGETSDKETLAQWLSRLAKARNDKAVKAVALEVDSPRLSWAQAQEIADAVTRLDKVKPVYAFVVSPDKQEYLVASAARHITTEPAGEVGITGIAAEMMFFRGTLDLLGLQAQMVQIGKFKGAAEPLTATQPSEELKGEYAKLLDSLYEQLVSQIARQRKLDPAAVKAVIDEGPLAAEDAQKGRLVDDLKTLPEWKQMVEAAAAGEDEKEVEWVRNYEADKPELPDFSNPFSLLSTILKGPKTPQIKSPTIAVIHADGVITMGESDESDFGDKRIGARTLVREFGKAADDDRIKAVVLRINSPGGSALASEMIYQAVKACAKEKPVIVSISGMGASGGYYIALGGKTIFADGASIVGSIGVISGKIALTGLFNKLGISTFEMTRGKNAGLELSRAWSPRELSIVRRLSERVYSTFVQRVQESRGERVKDVSQVAQGRIFTAQAAAENGLVDKVGGLREAVTAAEEAAKVKNATIIYLPRPKTLSDILMGDGSDEDTRAPSFGTVDQALLKHIAGSHPGLGYFLNLCTLLQHESTLMAMPYYMQIER